MTPVMRRDPTQPEEASRCRSAATHPPGGGGPADSPLYFWRRFQAVNKRSADKSFFKSSFFFFLCGRSLTPPQCRLARLRRQSEQGGGGGEVFFKAALISASLLLPQRKFCFSLRLHLPLAVVSYSHMRRWRRRRHLLFPVFPTTTSFAATMLQGHTDFCVPNCECQPGLDSPVAGCHHRSNSLSLQPPVGGVRGEGTGGHL